MVNHMYIHYYYYYYELSIFFFGLTLSNHVKLLHSIQLIHILCIPSGFLSFLETHKKRANVRGGTDRDSLYERGIS